MLLDLKAQTLALETGLSLVVRGDCFIVYVDPSGSSLGLGATNQLLPYLGAAVMDTARDNADIFYAHRE